MTTAPPVNFHFVDLPKPPTTQKEIWQRAKEEYGGTDNVPDKVSLIIWGKAVVDAKLVEGCPECCWVGDIYELCGYHSDRECPGCGAILGTVTPCKCD